MIRHWAVLDLDVFRRHERDPLVRYEIQDNHDGTHFIAYDIRSFPSELVIASSPTMATALRYGVYAVEQLRREEPAAPPFHGRCFCGQKGLYVRGTGDWFCEQHRAGIYGMYDHEKRHAV
jgi:hypothetical protein